MISLIVAVDSEYGFAKGHRIPWLNEEWSKKDLKKFREITAGGNLIMGRNTYNEIAGLREIKEDILPGRKSYVVTSDIEKKCKGAITVSGLTDVLNLDNLFIIGGQKLFEEGEKYADIIHLTQSKKSYGCDQFFIPDRKLWKYTWYDGDMSDCYHITKYKQKPNNWSDFG
jgi:dihydrofolate reductase